MSGSSGSNQGGTVEYICIPPLIFQGVGIFYTFPSTGEMQNARCKMQNGFLCDTADSYFAAFIMHVLLIKKGGNYYV